MIARRAHFWLCFSENNTEHAEKSHRGHREPGSEEENLLYWAADPGNAILLNGVRQTANREIGVPGFQPQVAKSTSRFRFCRGKELDGIHYDTFGTWSNFVFSLCGDKLLNSFAVFHFAGVDVSL
jgi:hypothetical protein